MEAGTYASTSLIHMGASSHAENHSQSFYTPAASIHIIHNCTAFLHIEARTGNTEPKSCTAGSVSQRTKLTPRHHLHQV